MDLNLLPEGASGRGGGAAGPGVGLSLEGARREDVIDRAEAAAALGFAGIEIAATGEPWAMHAPAIDADGRAALARAVGAGRPVAVLAPSQSTFDLTLVSPSAAIRRASVTELWAVCRFAGALVSDGGAATVVVRTGVGPVGASGARESAHLSECLTTLDRMAGEHGARVALLDADFFRDRRRFAALRPLGLKHTGAVLDLCDALDRDAAAAPDAVVAGLADWVLDHADLLAHVRVPDAVSPALEPLAAALVGVGYAGMVCVVPAAHAPEADRIGRVRAWWAAALGITEGDEHDDRHERFRRRDDLAG